MVYGAIDLHMRYQPDSDRRRGRAGVVRDRARGRRARERLRRRVSPESGRCGFCSRPGTESEWVAQALEEAGHAVVVADPNFAPMYGEVRRRVKTDRRDVAALAEANRRGWYRPAHRASPAQRHTRQVLRSRRLLGADAHRDDLATAVGAAASGLAAAAGQQRGVVPRRLDALALPAGLRGDARAAAPDDRATDGRRSGRWTPGSNTAAASDPIVQRLQSVPGVGPIVALTFRALVDDVERFAHRRPGECRDRAGAARRQFGGAPPARPHHEGRARASSAAC